MEIITISSETIKKFPIHRRVKVQKNNTQVGKSLFFRTQLLSVICTSVVTGYTNTHINEHHCGSVRILFLKSFSFPLLEQGNRGERSSLVHICLATDRL